MTRIHRLSSAGISVRLRRNTEYRTELRDTRRLPILQNRVFWGGALSGGDIEAVHRTVSRPLKLHFPDPEMELADDDLEWMVRVALGSLRRVREQQKRCLRAELRSPRLSCTLGVDGAERFVATQEPRSDEAIDSDPLPPGLFRAIGPGAVRGSTASGRLWARERAERGS